jgi:phage shock protein PspC (stress-responsive transcriptional regulator)
VFSRLRYILEMQLFGVCSAMGEKMGISIQKIRMWFIYISFATFGSPIIIYFVLAFWKKMKSYAHLSRRNPLKFN